ncbi:class I SAM-dependent methyltransferase [Maridesulfovibrio sp. FT414]|uniref:class I SAM-dependent methyltransferase n=1 Tax=Maridesulfovibrio sp. FT414 TaxID=2979469 RepID=UPI003D80831F
MPHSEPEGKDWIFERYYLLLKMSRIRSVLDIGPGCGTYSNLLRPLDQSVHWTGVEVWAPYIKQFGLEEKYDRVVVSDLRYINFTKIRQPDCVIAGDVLEHISEKDARIILSELVRIAKVIFVSIPIIHMPQGEWGGNPFEEHVEDSYSHERLLKILPCVCDFHCGERIGSYLLSKDVDVHKMLNEWNKLKK